jgi:hypothetical protein
VRCVTVSSLIGEIGVYDNIDAPATLEVLGANGNTLHPVHAISGPFPVECYAASSPDTVVMSDYQPPSAKSVQPFFVDFKSCQ